MKKLAQALVLGAALLGSTSALADFNVCNNSKFDEVFVAFGFHDEGAISSRGWFKVEEGNCAKVYEGDLTKADSNLFYVYGLSSDQKVEWKGKHKLCVKIPGPFEYKNAAKKCKSGEKRSFRRITADDKKNFTISLDGKKEKGLITFGSEIANEDIFFSGTESLN